MGSLKPWIALFAVGAIGAAAYFLTSAGDALDYESTDRTAPESTTNEAAPIAPTVADSAEEPEAVALDRAAVESAPTPESAAKTAKRAANCTVTGRVVDEAGRPLAGVPVRVDTIGAMVIIDESGQRQGPGERKTTTGRDGRFELKDVVAGFGFSVKAEPTNLVLASKPLSRPEGGTLDVGDLVCEIGGTLVGRVVDDTGNGIAGAEVRAWTVDKPAAGGAGMILLGDGGAESARTAKTDAAGSFQISGLKSGEVAFSASAEGYTRESKKGVSLKKGETTPEMKLALSSGLTIEGVIVDRAGRALAGAKVNIMETIVDLSEGGFSSELQKSREIVADGNGNFRIAGLKTANYHVLGSADGYLSTTEESVPAGTRDLRVELDKAGMLHGYVRNSTNGSPVSDFQVTVRSEDAIGMVFVPGRNRADVVYGDKAAAVAGLADGNGLFAIPTAPGRKLVVEIRADGYAASEEISIDVPPGASIRKDIEIVPEIRLSGIVYTPDGEPAPDAIVSLTEKTAADAPSRGVFRARRVTADVDGEGGSDIHFDGQMPTARTDAEGRFTLKGLKPGDYAVGAQHKIWADSDPQSVALKIGDDIDGLELALKVAGILTGVAHDSEGKPLAGARVNLTPRAPKGDGEFAMLAGMSLPGGDPHGSDKSLSATSGSDGSYRIEGITPGEYLVDLVKPQTGGSGGGAFFAMAAFGGEAKGVPVTIEAGAEAQQDLFLPATGRVHGAVSETGGPLEGVSVSLKKADQGFFPMPAASAKTDARGRFELADVEPGEYTLSVKPAGAAAPIERKIDVRARQTANEDIRLPTGAMRGKVRDISSNKPLAGVTIEVKKHRDANDPAAPPSERRAVSMVMIASGGSGGATQTMTFGDEQELVKTDADGNFEVRYLEPGDYDVEIRGAGISPDKKERVTVREGAITEQVDFDATRGATLILTAKPANPDEPLMFVIAEVTATNDPSDSRREAGGGDSITIEGLKPGTYRVKLSSNELEGETTVTVESGDVTPIEVTLH